MFTRNLSRRLWWTKGKLMNQICEETIELKKRRKQECIHLPWWIETTWWCTTSPDLFIHVTASGYIKSTSNSHTGSVQGSRTRFRHMTTAIHFLIVDRMLIVIIGLQRELGTANRAFETSRVKEGKILQRSYPVDLVNGLRAS